LVADGPTTPSQKLISVDDKNKAVGLTDNAKLDQADRLFERGEKLWTTVKSGNHGKSFE